MYVHHIIDIWLWVDSAIDIFTQWFDLPSIATIVPEEQVKSITLVFENYTQHYLQGNSFIHSFSLSSLLAAQASSVNEVKQFHYLACASIFKGIFLLLQTQQSRNYSVLPCLNGAFWQKAAEEVLSFPYAEAVGDNTTIMF